MQKYLEKSGKTPDDAIAAALAELRMDRDDVSVEILELGKSGFLGIGASPAVVRVSYEAEDEPAVEAPRPARTEKPAKAEKPEKAEKPARVPAAPAAAEAPKPEQALVDEH